MGTRLSGLLCGLAAALVERVDPHVRQVKEWPRGCLPLRMKALLSSSSAVRMAHADESDGVRKVLATFNDSQRTRRFGDGPCRSAARSNASPAVCFHVYFGAKNDQMSYA